MQPILQHARRICAFLGTLLPLKGWFPPKKVEVVAKYFRAPWLSIGCIFCCTSDAALALSIPPKVRSQNAKKVV